VDGGVGILHSLRQNPRFAQTRDDQQALSLALKKGISGVAADATRGQGLWHLQRICQRFGGRLTVRSGTAQLFLDPDKRLWFQTSWIPGTQIRLEFFQLNP